MSGYVYILIADHSGRIYFGSTVNPEHRLWQHNSHAVASTRGKGPWRILKLMEFVDAAIARRAEQHLKRQKSRKVLDQVLAGTYKWPEELGNCLKSPEHPD